MRELHLVLQTSLRNAALCILYCSQYEFTPRGFPVVLSTPLNIIGETRGEGHTHLPTCAVPCRAVLRRGMHLLCWAVSTRGHIRTALPANSQLCCALLES